MRAREICREIERRGGVFVGYKGSHRKYVVHYGDGRHCRTEVAMHPGDVPEGTRRAIERQLAPALGKRWLYR